jgi:pimeloyl-ACP methyl ester carboxylesterase
MTDLFASINGIKICYEIKGEGSPVILIHGFGAKKESWIAQFKPLSEKFKTIRMDNRGSGKSDRPKGDYTMEVFADDIKGLLDYLQIKKTHIIGWSVGGMIVQNFVLKYPECVNKVVLINTNYGTPDEQGPEVYKKMRLDALEKIKADPVKAFWEGTRVSYHRDFRKEMESNPNKKFYDLWTVEDLIQETVIDPPTPQDIINTANAMLTHNTFERLNQIKNETLLIAASHDRITPKSVMVEMDEVIPNTTLKVIDKAGHSSPRSRAPEVNKMIIDFLETTLEQIVEIPE